MPALPTKMLAKLIINTRIAKDSTVNGAPFASSMSHDKRSL